MIAPDELLAAVAVRITAETDLPASSDRAPIGAAVPYATVTSVTGPRPTLAGDNTAQAYTALVQVSLWQAPGAVSGPLLRELVAALDNVALPGHPYRGRLVSIDPIPEPESDVVHHALTLRYALAP